MQMKALFVFVALAMMLVMVNPCQADDGEMVAHFVVVKSGLEGVDYNQEIPALELFFMEKAGGFTLLGETRGGSLQTKSVTRQANSSYLVVAEGNIAKAIDDFVRERFGDGPFILTWRADIYRPVAEE